MSIPADGEVIQGGGFVDQAAITGESMPVEKNAGDKVISATINRNGSFHMRATKVGDDTTLAQIIRLVDDAGNSKAPIARLADKVSGVFVPVVIGIALVTAIVWLVCRRDGRIRTVLRNIGAGHILPVRAGSGNARRDHGRHG